MSPKTYKNCENRGSMKMQISTKPLIQTLQCDSQLLSMNLLLIIEKIYDDRIPPKCHPKTLETLPKNERMKISTKPLYKLFSVVHNYFL